ncbi:uncharacterized protein [Dysidea avara]|uniref:uncharacterized protein n=1 Tax=Dysidea avara TaxID=196820 RepID=UPI00332DA11B
MDSGTEFLLEGVVDPAEYVKESNAFLEKMKHKNAFDLVKSIKEFTSYFLEGNYTPDEQSKLVHEFVKSFMDRIIMHPLWISEGKEAIDQGSEALERYLMHKLYGITFHHPSNSDMTADERFFYQLRRLQFIQPTHLDIPDRPLNSTAFELAAQEFCFLDHERCKSPREKLACMLNAIKIITNLLRHYGDEESTGADDLFPYLIFTILKASPKQFHSNIRFIYRFRHKSRLIDEPAYYLMQVETAVAFIENISCKELSISEGDFQCGVSESEEKIRNGKDVVPDLLAQGIRRFIDRDEAMMTGTITPTDSILETSSVFNNTSRLSVSSLHNQLVTSTPAVQPHSSLPNGSLHLHHQHPSSSSHNSTSQDTASTKIGTTNDITDSDFIVEKFLTSQLEDLTVAELRHLLHSYQSLAHNYLELRHRTKQS